MFWAAPSASAPPPRPSRWSTSTRSSIAPMRPSTKPSAAAATASAPRRTLHMRRPRFRTPRGGERRPRGRRRRPRRSEHPGTGPNEKGAPLRGRPVRTLGSVVSEDGSGGRAGFTGGRHFRDRLQDLRCDLVGVPHGVRAAIFQIALVAIVDEGVRHADRSATVSHAVAELVPRRRLVLAGQAHVVVRTVDGDVGVDVLLELLHQGFEIVLAADFAHELGREVRVHARAVPVGIAERLAVPLDVDAVGLAQAHHDVAGDPHLVGRGPRTLAEDLEFPLALRQFGVDALMVDAGLEAELEVLLDDLAGDRADVLEADAGVVGALRRRVTVLGEAERAAVLVEEILLFEAEPGGFVIEDGGALVRRMRSLAVRHHDFAHDQRAVLARAVRKHRDRLEDAVRRVAFGLHRRRTVEAPQRKLVEGREGIEFLDLRLATQVRYRRVSVEPNILELILRHAILSVS